MFHMNYILSCIHEHRMCLLKIKTLSCHLRLSPKWYLTNRMLCTPASKMVSYQEDECTPVSQMDSYQEDECTPVSQMASYQGDVKCIHLGSSYCTMAEVNCCTLSTDTAFSFAHTAVASDLWTQRISIFCALNVIWFLAVIYRTYINCSRKAFTIL
jgi:hypothetical protein